MKTIQSALRMPIMRILLIIILNFLFNPIVCHLANIPFTWKTDITFTLLFMTFNIIIEVIIYKIRFKGIELDWEKVENILYLYPGIPDNEELLGRYTDGERTIDLYITVLQYDKR